MNYTTLANGAPVHGLSATHMLQHTNVLPVLAEALATIDPTGLPRFSKHTIDLGRPIGIMDRVTTTAEDKIVYAVRKGRSILSRFVMDRVGEETSKISLILLRRGGPKEAYQLVTAYFGEAAEMEPDDPNIKTIAEWNIAAEFWSKNALIWGTQMIDDGWQLQNSFRTTKFQVSL